MSDLNNETQPFPISSLNEVCKSVLGTRNPLGRPRNSPSKHPATIFCS